MRSPVKALGYRSRFLRVEARSLTPSMVAVTPSTLFDTMSRAPLRGLVATPIRPLAIPFAKPLAPSFFAPEIGFVKMPEMPETSPLARDSPPATSPSPMSSTFLPDFLLRAFSNLSSSERAAAVSAMVEMAPVVTLETMLIVRPLNKIGKICFEKSLLILAARRRMNDDCFSFRFRISQLFKILIFTLSMSARPKPKLLAKFKPFGLEVGSVSKLT
mmetsp:Transcript_10644/g.22028  ORF Transcript_10644/g.22028 Transcript_10644/m.22028 type:complete len:216 (-) Transcript_10644:2630-3277(-)